MLNERTQAFLAAKFYEYLKLEYNNLGILAFKFATKNYANQRGKRMAKRAIRDGKELTYEVYCQYGEWINTKNSIKNNIANKVDFVENGPDIVMNISQCPWRFQFKSMGAVEAGITFCKYLDKSLIEGFNSDIDYSVRLETLDGSEKEYCVHTIEECKLNKKDISKNQEYLREFDYHCAHLFWSFRETIIDIFGYKGLKISNQVLEDCVKEYGEKSVESILEFKNVNFNLI